MRFRIICSTDYTSIARGLQQAEAATLRAGAFPPVAQSLRAVGSRGALELPVMDATSRVPQQPVQMEKLTGPRAPKNEVPERGCGVLNFEEERPISIALVPGCTPDNMGKP